MKWGGVRRGGPTFARSYSEDKRRGGPDDRTPVLQKQNALPHTRDRAFCLIQRGQQGG